MNSSEELLEALTMLEKENERLYTDAQHAKHLVRALDSLLHIEVGTDPFLNVFEALRGVFKFEHALVLSECEDGGLICIAAVPRSLIGLRLDNGSFFRRVLDGRVTATLDSSNLEHWSNLTTGLVSARQPGLYMPVSERDRRGLLVLLQHEAGEGFSRSDVALAKRFSLLASHALAARQAHQLIQSNEARAIAAEDANKSKNLFIANMSHELRTPLNAIIGFSEFMHMGILGEVGNQKYREYIENILNSGKHLLAIVNNLLLHAKIEAGQHAVHIESVDVIAEIDYVVRMLQMGAGARRVDLDWTPDSRRIEARCDQQGLRQILLNVVGNAVKFSPDNTRVTIELSTMTAMENCIIRITDEACGIPAETLAKLGSPFVQAENVFTRQHQGTGLGLAISFGLAAAMGARISMNSELRKGTSVTITLPMARTKQSIAV